MKKLKRYNGPGIRTRDKNRYLTTEQINMNRRAQLNITIFTNRFGY